MTFNQWYTLVYNNNYLLIITDFYQGENLRRDLKQISRESPFYSVDKV